MFKKQFMIPVLIVGVAAAFVFVSFLVFLTGGRPSLVKKKLKIGALLIALTGMVSCDLFDGKGTHTCYVPAPPPNAIHITDPAWGEYGIELDLSTGNILGGRIENRKGADFSFRIEDEENVEMQRDDIAALDGEFDEYTEEFEIEVREDLSTGLYYIHLFDVGAQDQPVNLTSYKWSFRLNVTNESGSN